MVRLSEPPPHLAYQEAKAQLRQIRRTVSLLREADRIQEQAVEELMHHAAHDFAERRRQAREGAKENLRQIREAERSVSRPGRPRRVIRLPPNI